MFYIYQENKDIVKVSIIIPVYNSQKFLKECLDSAINQTFSDFEIIVVNDGSTDNSLEILQSYSDKIKIVSKTNGGTASAINSGIKIASGEWIQVLGSDDILYPTALETLVSEASKLKDKKNTILYANFDVIDEDGNLIGNVTEPNFNEIAPFDFNVILLDHHFGNGNTVLFHTSTFSEYGLFNEKLFNHEDYELSLRFCILCDCRMKLISKTLAKYRIHSNQKTKFSTHKAIERTEKMRKEILNKLSPNKREKYQQALKQYKKNKSLTEKGKHFFRYILFKVLPTSASIRFVDAYRNTRNKIRQRSLKSS